ncbi:MAG: signal peptidase I [Oscillospiraceae bacterium]|jgi:signal peptidase I|nr:signal peptidase I [Oscillospiraceae bacterium]
MAKSLYEVNRDFFGEASPIPEGAPIQPPRQKRRGYIKRLGDGLFYLALALVLLVAFTRASVSGAPRVILGYSYFTVLSSSMQSEIPRGSLIFVKQTPDSEIKVGDTVSYQRDAHTNVTHKVVEIFENYNNSGARGFRTQGVNNPAPDPDIVYAANVVGVVVLHIPMAGAALAYLGEHIYVVFILFGLLLLLSFSLGKLFALARGETPPPVKTSARQSQGFGNAALFNIIHRKSLKERI